MNWSTDPSPVESCGNADDEGGVTDDVARDMDVPQDERLCLASETGSTRMYRPRRWTVADADERAGELAQRLKTSPLIAQVLLNRGIIEPDDCHNFLRPSLKCLHEPSLIAHLPRAAERIAKAIRDGEKIVLYGDYDVDGITAVAILWHAIKLLGGRCEYYIPHRLEEGYGLNAEAVAQLCDAGAKLIVTVDCGITAIAPANIARERGVELIVTDHHEWHELAAPLTDSEPQHAPLLPNCYAIVHPRLRSPDGTQESLASSRKAYPNPHLCGAGVAFKLAWGIGQAISGAPRVSEDFRNFLMDALALAALGTIADVVPLVGENRILAHYGLSNLKKSKLLGIQSLIRSAGLDGQILDSYHVGFLLAPRLNAAGRLGHARLAVEMLTDANLPRAEEIATYLEQQNRQRQAIEKQILEEAMEQALALKYDAEDCHGIVLGKAGWHAGVVGIVASRIVDRFNRPTIMVSLNDGEGLGQGSGRSVSGFHLARALEACGEHLEAFGGHEMAAGLKIRTSRFEDFRAAFCAFAARNIDPQLLVPELRLDASAELNHVTHSLVTDLKRLGPFGHGNRRPLFVCRGLTLSAPPRRVGKTGDHLQLLVKQGPSTMRCIAFGAGALFEKLKPGMTLDLAVEPQLNEFNGHVSVELEVKDMQFA
jgi:single-stranded-DNA-specific exonuclease